MCSRTTQLPGTGTLRAARVRPSVRGTPGAAAERTRRPRGRFSADAHSEPTQAPSLGCLVRSGSSRAGTKTRAPLISTDLEITTAAASPPNNGFSLECADAPARPCPRPQQEAGLQELCKLQTDLSLRFHPDQAARSKGAAEPPPRVCLQRRAELASLRFQAGCAAAPQTPSSALLRGARAFSPAPRLW